MPDAPIKTPAGEDEIRRRTRRLGQRYRTVLLLIDGKRSIDEVLRLAQQAGAAVSHFEELVELGLVGVPVAEASLEPDVHAGSLEPVEAAESAVHAGSIESDERAESAESGELAQSPATGQASREPAGPKTDAGNARAPSAPAASPRPPVAPAVVVIESAHDETPEERLIQQVRDLLIDTLRIDSPLFGARTFFRVRSAQSHEELIDLVWEIENHLARARHTRDELISLQRARELLGMGNTRFAGETNPGKLAE